MEVFYPRRKECSCFSVNKDFAAFPLFSVLQFHFVFSFPEASLFYSHPFTKPKSNNKMQHSERQADYANETNLYGLLKNIIHIVERLLVLVLEQNRKTELFFQTSQLESIICPERKKLLYSEVDLALEAEIKSFSLK